MHKSMDWRSIKFDWNRARAFLVTVEEGSLSAAARALGMTQPTLGRQVSALEQELGVVLFERVGQGLEVTPVGLELAEHARAMGQAASRLSLAASGKSQNIEGNICISASEVYAVFLLPPIIAQLRRSQPKIQVELVATNQTSDLSRREADIAIRNFQPTQNELIARRIRDDIARLYATAEYLQQLGNPQTRADFSAASFVGFDASGMVIDELNRRGFNLAKSNFPILSENYIAHWELVKQGLGIGIMPEQIGDAEPLVERALDDFAIEFPIWLTTHRELRTSRRVRIVYDLLAKMLA
jgi:DNA-binding transcriptional LysR family regulator